MIGETESIENIITEAIYETDEDAEVKSFKEAGMLTNDTGIVIDTDGKRFIVTIQEA